MVFTQSQQNDIKDITKKIIQDYLQEEIYLQKLATIVSEMVVAKIEDRMENLLKKCDEMGETIKRLESENEELRGDLDDLEQYTRRNNLRIFGVKEEVNENVENRVLSVCNTNLGLSITTDHIARCHRVGKPGSLMCIPFGIMLGWPSSTYPKLLAESSPIPISIDQSAMIAGFLMIGNTLGTPFSSWSFLGTKYGILFGLLNMLIGWLMMWYATDIFFLLGSRLLIGLGNGYGSGQLKIYLKELCDPHLAPVMLKLVNFYTFFGVILAYIIGYFCSFTDFSLVAILITTVIFLMSFLLPHTPKEYLRYGKIGQAKTMLRYLKPNSNLDQEIRQIKMKLEDQVEELSFFQMLRHPTLRKRFAIVGLLTFFMQFTGAPSTIIYTQIIFTSSQSPYPELWAIGYAMWFFVSNFLGVFCFSKINQKSGLLFSILGVILTTAFSIVVFYYDLNSHWEYIALVTMFCYIFFHSVGLAVIPFALTQTYFPENARKVVSHFQIMQHSALALIITKVFQVLYDRLGLYVPFCLYVAVAIIGCLFIIVFVPYESVVLEEATRTKNSPRI